jgi:hypothetical protein
VWAVRTSQETRYVSATEPNRLMLFGETASVVRTTRMESVEERWLLNVKADVKIEECRLLGCYAVWLLYEPRFRRNLAPPSSG